MRPLIVIASMPRSGSTWIGKIFDSHPETIYRHEPDGEGRLGGLPLFPPRSKFPDFADTMTRFIESLPAVRSVRVTCKQPLFPKSYYGTTARLARDWGAKVALVADRALGPVRAPEFLSSDDYSRFKTVWKSIESVGRLGLIARVAPSATVFHLLRHPCGYVASMLRGERHGRFDKKYLATEDFAIFDMLAATDEARAHGLSAPALRELAPAERLAWRWALENEKAMRDTAGLPNVSAIRYEDFCSEPIATATLALGRAGLEMHAQVSQFLNSSTSHASAAYYSVFKDPVKSANQWRQELDADTIKRVLAISEQTLAGRQYLERRAL